MTSRNRFYYRCSIALVAIGGLLLLIGIGQWLFNFRVFDSSPVTIGAGLAAVGAIMAGSMKAKDRD